SIFRWASCCRCSSACSAAFSDVRGLGISSSGISITILRQPRQSQAVLYLLKRLPSWRISISGPLAPKNRLGQPGHHWTLSRPPVIVPTSISCPHQGQIMGGGGVSRRAFFSFRSSIQSRSSSIRLGAQSFSSCPGSA
ncbi:hypothetical protein HHFLNI_HHFLNI_09530, partial [Dysosmobacter welbionis]